MSKRTKRFKSLVGHKFGRLSVLQLSIVNKHRKSIWECLCDCGKIKIVLGDSLLHKGISSCGCDTQIKRKITNIKKYGFENPMQNGQVRNKSVLAVVQKYGLDYIFKDREKMKLGMIKKFGCNNPAFSEDIQKSRKQTLIERYGVDNPTKNKKIRLKAAKSSNKTRSVVYWETGEIFDLEGWEDFAAEYWNKNKTKYTPQPKTFDLDGLKTYTPDFYLPEQDLWIEVKGRWYDENSKEKWERFHQLFPNSELWNESKLKELKISLRRKNEQTYTK